jgi:2-polyprenyl-3-methyl-5-hydroxy-6-metoxy-1,4-benzoquinol methylase
MVVCNSVIEHVAEPALLANEIRRVGSSYFVQTPNARFPVETHSLIPIPFFNQLGVESLKRLLCRLFGADYSYVSSVRYLSEADLRRLFPEAEIIRERVVGMTKSYYVVLAWPRQ